MLNFRTLLPLLFLSILISCDEEKPSSTPWQGIERTMRYHPDGEDFVITNGERRFNRALYGTNTGFRVEAGDLPEFALYLPGMGGNLKLGIEIGENSKWLIDAEEIISRYRPGSMIYEIRDPMFDRGILTLHLLALSKDEGLILKINSKNLPEECKLYWAFGGATGKKFSRDGDIGADPESNFYLKPEYCRDNDFFIVNNIFTLYFGSGRVKSENERYENNYTPTSKERRESMLRDKRRIYGLAPPGSEIRVADANSQDSPSYLFQSESSEEPLLSGKIHLGSDNESFILLKVPDENSDFETFQKKGYNTAPLLFESAEKVRKKTAGRIVVRTPDPYINTFGGALGVAAEAIWEEPAYLHGAVAWRMHLAGWRGAYTADWLGWHDRARMQFDSYSKSQYTSPEYDSAAPDPKTNLSRQIEKAGYSIFTDGYISRRPGRINPPHHYDMNLVFIDQLLWHFNWNGDLEYAREIWPVIQRHLAWEKRCFDADGDGLYNAYCCIWASDALQYNGGGVTHSSAYNYRGNLLAARIADLIGENGQPYLEEAKKIRDAVQEHLWLEEKGWYAEYRDILGKQLVHPSPALWTIYHALDAGLPDPFQAYQSLRYIDTEIPHIPLLATGMPEGEYYTLSTSTWMPYTWSINNVALSENLHTSLAYWQGGRKEEAFNLWKSQFLESMYNGASPGNFQQLSFYDAFRGELYRDFADPVGMAARTLVEGLFGVVPDALEQQMLVRPGFPDAWDSAYLETPDITYHFQRTDRSDHYTIAQRFPVNMDIILQVRARGSLIDKVLVNGRETEWSNLAESVGYPVIEIKASYEETIDIMIQWSNELPDLKLDPGIVAQGEIAELNLEKGTVTELYDPQDAVTGEQFDETKFSFTATGLEGHRTLFAKIQLDELEWWQPIYLEIDNPIDFIPADTMNSNELRFTVKNNKKEPVEGELWVNGKDFSDLKIPVGGTSVEILVPSNYIIPGSNHVKLITTETVYEGIVISWNIKLSDAFKWELPDLSSYFNDHADQIFRNKYLSPRASSPTLQIPIQGIGDWCSYNLLPEIEDDGIRQRAGDENRFELDQGIPFKSPGNSDVPNIIYTSQWDNYPDAISVPISGNANHAYFLMTGSAHHMQSRMTNGMIRVEYIDGSLDSLPLIHPDTWWPIEQDYYEDGYAFHVETPKPPRIYLKTGEQQQGDYEVRKKNGTNEIDGGAATVYDLPLDPSKELKELTLETYTNDVVIGLMSVSLLR